jgi:uncharacterized protein YbjT (DUF2867 family)
MIETALPHNSLALVTGATGYIGGRLIPELLTAGFRVRVMARQPRHLANREWSKQVEIVQGDAADSASLVEALRDVRVAYYLIHSLGAGATFESLDHANAYNFAACIPNQRS